MASLTHAAISASSASAPKQCRCLSAGLIPCATLPVWYAHAAECSTKVCRCEASKLS